MAKRTTLFDLAEYLRGTVTDIQREKREEERLALSLLQLGAQIEQHRENRNLQIQNLKAQHLNQYRETQKQLIAMGGVPETLASLNEIDKTGNADNIVDNYSTWLQELGNLSAKQVENMAWAQKGNMDALRMDANGDRAITPDEVSAYITSAQIKGDLVFPTKDAEKNYRHAAELDTDTQQQLLKLADMIATLDQKSTYTEHIEKKTEKIDKGTRQFARSAQGAQNDYNAGKDAFKTMKDTLRLAFADAAETPESAYAHNISIVINPETGSKANLHTWLRQGMNIQGSPQSMLNEIFGIVNPSEFAGYGAEGHSNAYQDMQEGGMYAQAAQWLANIQGDFGGTYNVFNTSNANYLLGVEAGFYNVDGSPTDDDADPADNRQEKLQLLQSDFPEFEFE